MSEFFSSIKDDNLDQEIREKMIQAIKEGVYEAFTDYLKKFPITDRDVTLAIRMGTVQALEGSCIRLDKMK